MKILESTGIGEPEFGAQFLVLSSIAAVASRVKNSGEYKALLVRLRDPDAHEQLFAELQDALQQYHVPEYANPMDIALLACRLAVYERQQYHKKWGRSGSGV